MSGLDVISVSPAGQQRTPDGDFPRMWQNRTPTQFDVALSWVRTRGAQLLSEATKHGAVLLRGFPVQTAEEFDLLLQAFELPNFPYTRSLSNAVRVNRTERVFTANEAPCDITIYLHHEMAQTPLFPRRIFFFCQQPADEGGSTPLCRSDWLLKRLTEEQPEFVNKCRTHGLRYSNVMPSADDLKSGMGRSWQSTLAADRRDEAEARLGELNYTWEWTEDGLRVTTPILPAIRQLEDGRTIFFNQLIAAFHGWKDSRNDPDKAVRFGDDSPLDGSAVRAAAEIAEELTFDIPWQQGDVALVDNFVAMHGRRAYRGERTVLASLAMAQTLDTDPSSPTRS